ncbi:amino acid permease, partial [Thermodesulfobacteriota bacterium]
WWGDSTSRLMLLLAYLMTRDEAWDEAKIRVLAAGHEKGSEVTMEDLQKTLQEVRIEAEPEIIDNVNADAIIKRSAHSAVVFLPFRLRGNKLIGPVDGQLDDLISRLPVVSLVLASEDIDLEAEPEDGKAGELASALDALEDAEKRAREAEKAAAEASEEAEKKLKEMDERIAAGGDGTLRKKVKAALEARGKAGEAARKAAKALAKAENAAKAAKDLGAGPSKKDEEV